ncbi:PadR family transcriptional regulator [Streptomyces sp. PSKA54]|uniref:PadR family transcriptional regulator n=1 Tax=Streptomyces himalayensis subsp. aureolus TaxID=2758039 RepID=A0A7W2D2D6_9ACTN|nr:PadR family transcriptional regulator [Streptomyces himalayensis]MBA4863366.1 PadR family transcriptional regulator [Streptomyces himalayensis subsp. aureolus]
MTTRQVKGLDGDGGSEPGGSDPGRPHRGDQGGRLPATAWAVLGLLSFPGERTGYELKKWADASLAFFYWSPAISQIYAELRRLEGLGYASSRVAAQGDLRNKRLYTITEAGRAALARWADTADAGPAVLKHPLVLRVWLGHLADPDGLRSQLRAHRERTQAQLREIERAQDVSHEIGHWPYPEVALRWSERHHRAELELAEAMLADLERMWQAGEEAYGGQAAGGG